MSRRLLNVLKLSLVLTLSLLLLIFVGLGEARRTYPQFEIERLGAQGELVQNAMRTFLLADLPLEQFPGFATLTEPIIKSDTTIHAFYVTDLQGQVVFSNLSPQQSDSENNLDFLDSDLYSQFSASSLQAGGDRFSVAESDKLYQVSFDLKNRFDTVGYLHITMPKSVVDDTIIINFNIVILAALLTVIIFAGFIFITSGRWMEESEAGWQKEGVRLLSFSYGTAFLILAVTVTITLLNIYSNGIRGKARALTNSLDYRLNAAFSYGLALEDFVGLDNVFADYQKLNPDLSYVSLTVDDRIVIHTDAGQIGKHWATDPSNYEYKADIGQEEDNSGGKLALHVGIPKSIVYRRLWRSAKNFLALFVASGFLTQLFFSLIRSQSNQPRLTPGTLHTKRGFLLSLIGPIYFLIIFVTNGLTASFLPQYFQELAIEAGTTINISTLFSIYYATYALSLLIAARLAEEKDTKPMLIGGGSLVLLSLLLLIFVRNFIVLFLVQAITGFGEGLFFIAVQSYILKIAAKHQRTTGASIVVNSLYGGLLSGTAIGALLVVDPTIGHRGVFVIGGLIMVFILLYVLQLIPRISGEDFSEPDEKGYDAVYETLEIQDPEAIRQEIARRQREAERRGSTISIVLKDLEFIATVILVGIPVKIILTGLFKATLPLVLSQQNYPTEDVGQIMMLYAGGVLASSAFIPRIADRIGKTKIILFAGAVGSGLGLVLMGLIGWDILLQSGLPFLGTLLLLTGIVILGVSHGFIQAPIITHISNTKTADLLGKSSATSLYRLFERVGNIGGPLLVGGLLVQMDYSASVISWIGAGVFLLGTLFLMRFEKRPIL